MNTHKTIIWFSVLLILGEGLLLTEFEIIPIGGGIQGKVLGESTDFLLDELKETHFPASYSSAFVQQVDGGDALMEAHDYQFKMAAIEDAPFDDEFEMAESSQEGVSESAFAEYIEKVNNAAQLEDEADALLQEVSKEAILTPENVEGVEPEEVALEDPDLDTSSELDQMVDFLNVSLKGDVVEDMFQSEDEDTVSELIRKNRRVYLLDVQKELEEIKAELDYEEEL